MEDGKTDAGRELLPASSLFELTAYLDIFDGLADEQRLQLLVVLDREGPSTVEDILDLVGFGRQDIQQGLRWLQSSGMVRETRYKGIRAYQVTSLAECVLHEGLLAPVRTRTPV